MSRGIRETTPCWWSGLEIVTVVYMCARWCSIYHTESETKSQFPISNLSLYLSYADWLTLLVHYRLRVKVPANEYPIAAATSAETTLHYPLLYRWLHSGGSFGSMQTFPGLLLIYHHSTIPHCLAIVLHLLYLIFLALLSCWLFCYLCCLPLYYHLCKQTLMECLACYLNTK